MRGTNSPGGSFRFGLSTVSEFWRRTLAVEGGDAAIRPNASRPAHLLHISGSEAEFLEDLVRVLAHPRRSPTDAWRFAVIADGMRQRPYMAGVRVFKIEDRL